MSKFNTILTIINDTESTENEDFFSHLNSGIALKRLTTVITSIEIEDSL